MYVNLHSHSYYSVLDGFSSPDELAKRANELGMPGLALTDHGTLSGIRDFQQAARTHGITPILGVEAYISGTDRFDRRPIKLRDDNVSLYNHLIVLAKNADGYRNLSTMSTRAWKEGFYYKPRIDKELLLEHKDGLIILSGCLNGLISKAIERDDPDSANEWMAWFKENFDDDFYIEIQPHNPPEINHALLEYADAYNVKPVVTLDCHFASPEERTAEEMLLILSTKPDVNKEMKFADSRKMDIWERLNYIYPSRPISFEKLDLYLQSTEKILSDLEEMGITREDVVSNSMDVLGKIGEYEYHEGVSLLPEPKEDAYMILSKMCKRELKNRGLADNDEYVVRLQEELSVIREKKFSSYFLVVQDIVGWARKNDILVGPGRGSAAGSLVCYLLGITNVDPLKYGLLFSRFINEERNDFPDIDTDFMDDRRGEVKDYVKRKFKNVASVSTFSYFKGTGAVRDVARVFRIPLSDVEQQLKDIDSLEEFYTSRTTEAFRAEYPEVEEYCRKLQGRIRSVGIHAAGVVVSREPIENYAPIEYRKDPDSPTGEQIPVVALDKGAAEDLGLLKIDALGLKALTVISKTFESILARHHLKFDFDSIPLDDQAIYKMLSEGHTRGVFQAEAGPYTHLLQKMGVSDFNDLAVSNALVRPGAMNSIGAEYIERKHGIEPVTYVNDIMRSITEDTYGLIIYQEQVMRACVELAGFSWSEADKIRKLIGKKKDVSEFEEYREKFVKGAVEVGGLKEKYAEKLWSDFEAHANYSFNKSHAVAYSMLTYYTAWLKHYYPLEFMAATLANEKDTVARTVYLLECRRLGIKMLLPDVNRSDHSFAIDGDAIRFGLTNIKYVADAASKSIMRGRPYSSYEDFKKVASKTKSGISTRITGVCLKSGAIDFRDRPRQDVSEHLYELLGVPVFDDKWLNSETRSRLTRASDYEEDKAAIVYGLVMEVKRGKGWARVTIVDESGAASFFTSESSELKEGDVIVAVLGNKRLIDYAYASDIPTSDKNFAKFLMAPSVSIAEGKVAVLEFNTRKTKAGKKMATAIVVTSDLKIHSYLVFPDTYLKGLKFMVPGKVIGLELDLTKDGTEFVKEIRP
jgi:DNA polymerase III subunit alpha